MTGRQRVWHWFLGDLKWAATIERLEQAEARLVAIVEKSEETIEQLHEATDKLRATLAAGEASE